MKNLKRVLSMGLASVMLLGMMVIGASAANTTDFSDADKIQNTEAVTTMAALNVIKGKDDGSFDPTGNVTRGEMAKMITIIMNGGEEPVLATNAANPMFTDIGGHWAQKYIEYCATNGIIAGRGDGKFDPNANVTGTEAAKMALVALNYNSKVFKFEGDKDWMLNINSIANNPNNKLYTGLSKVNPANPLTRDEAAQLLYNALDAKMMTVSYDITNNGTIGTTYKVSENTTLMMDKFNTLKAEGIVMANEIVDLEGKSANEEGTTELVLTDDLYDNDNKKVESKGTSLTLNVSVDLETLGHAVTVYVRENKKNKNYDVVGGVVISTANVEATNFTGKGADDITKAVKTAADTKYFLNYAEVADEDALDIKPGMIVTILSNDSDKKAEYVFATEYALRQVGTVNTKKETMVFGAAGTGASAVKATSADFENIIGEYEDLEKGDYVLVTPVKVTGSKPVVTKYFVDIPETFDGELNAYKNNDEKKIVGLTIDKVKYDISWAVIPTGGDLERADTLKNLNNERTFYVDANGLVVAAAKGVEKAANYALSWGGANGNVIDTGRVKLTLADGTTKIYTIGEDSDWVLAVGKGGEVDGTTYVSTTTKVGGNGSDKDDYITHSAVAVIVTYSFDDDGNIEISIPEADTVNVENGDPDGITFTQGKTLLTTGTQDTNITKEYVLEEDGRTSYATNLTTPFFFVSMNEATGLIKKVEVFTGYKDTKGVAGADAASIVSKGTGTNLRAEAVAYVEAQDPDGVKVDLNNHMYVVNVDYTYSKYVTATVIMAGQEEETSEVELARNSKLEKTLLKEILPDATDAEIEAIIKNAENDDMKKVYAGHIWLYTINSSKRYELLDPATESENAGEGNEFWFADTVGKTSTISVELGANKGDAKEIFITDDSVIVNIDEDNTATAILGGGVEAGSPIEILMDPKTETVLMAKAGVAPCEHKDEDGKSILTHENAEAPTCTEDGTVEYYHCPECGKNFSDAKATTELKSIVDPATGHTYTWTVDADNTNDIPDGNHVGTCSECASTVEGHTTNHAPATDNDSKVDGCTECAKQTF